MRALCWHGKGDVRVDTVPDPKIEDPRDAIIRITSTAICGSDLHLFDGYMPTMETGDILGHEPMGDRRGGRQGRHEAEEGRPRRRPVHDLLRRLLVLQADRVLALRHVEPATPRSPARRWASPRPGLFGYSHMLGGYAGRPGRVPPRALRRRRPDQDPESDLPDEKVAVPLRHLPDRLHGRRERRDRAGRHGRGLGLRPGRPVRDPERLDARRRAGDRHRPGARAPGDGREAGQGRDDQLRRRQDVYDTLMEMTKGRGPGPLHRRGRVPRRTPAAASTRWSTRRRRRWGWPPTGRTSCARRSCAAARAARVSVPGVYIGFPDKIPFGAADEQGPDLQDGPDARAALHRAAAGEDRGRGDRPVVRHHAQACRSTNAPEMYKTFRDKKDGCIKVVLKP